jgi:BirA family transcriptional regulator, biotin operon repressor / biotin---[acetyl-CoA-carboxylase] ligase
MKFKIFNYENVTSTNDVAIDLINKGKEEYGCICSANQSKGRGTHGKVWISKKGNFFGSIFFPLKNNYPTFNEFTIINPIIISDVIKYFCKKDSINLKFPNDILVNKKKICGILQELITSHGKKFLITGIGLNIISNPHIKGTYLATNILSQTQKKPKMEKIIHLIIASYEKFFTNLNSYNYIEFKKKAELMSLKY